MGNPICTTAKSDGRTDNGATADICNCGTAAATPTTATNKYCAIKADGVTGLVLPNPVCTTAKSTRTTDNGATADICNCGTAAATPTTATNKYCLVTGTTGAVYPQTQCGATTATEGTGAAKVTSICHCGSTAIASAANTCSYCFAAANYVGVNGAVVDCATTDGSAAHTKGPNKCKCGTNEACATGAVCYTGASWGTKCRAGGGAAGQGVLAACNNLVAAVALDDDCLCGTIKADKTKFCFAAKNVQQAAAIATCASVDGSAASTTGVCTCGTNTCVSGERCTSATNTCSSVPTADPTAAPTYALSTITQAVTFSGLTAAQWTGNLKTAGEIGYAKAQG